MGAIANWDSSEYGTLSNLASVSGGVLTLGTATRTSVEGAQGTTDLDDKWLYLKSDGLILGVGSGGPTVDEGISDAVVAIQLSGTILESNDNFDYDVVTILKNTVNFKINNAAVAEVNGTALKDTIELGSFTDTVGVSLGAGEDVLTLSKASGEVKITDAQQYEDEKTISYESAKLTTGAESNLSNVTLETGAASSNELTLNAHTSGITLAGATFDTGKFTVTGGHNADDKQKLEATLTGGAELTNTLTTVGGGSLNVSVESGTYTDTALSAATNSNLVNLNFDYANKTYAAEDTTSSISIVGGEVAQDVVLDMSAQTDKVTDYVTITDLDANVTHQMSSGGAELHITDDAATGVYTVGNATDENTVGIVKGEMQVTPDATTKITIDSLTTAAKDWSFKDNAGAVVAKTGTTEGNDNIVLDGAMDGFTLTSGTGDDTVTFTNNLVSGGTDKVSVSAGLGDDIFDVSNRTTSTESQDIVVDYSPGTKLTTGSTDGYDVIFVGKKVNENDWLWNETDTLVINGVKFDVAAGDYVKFGYNTSGKLEDSNVKYSVYYADASEGKLVYAGEGSEGSDDVSTEGYNAADGTKLEKVNADQTDTTSTSVATGFSTDDAAKTTTVTADQVTAAKTAYGKAGDTALKFLNLESQDWSATGKSIDMGSKGTSYVLVGKESAAAGTIEMGGSKKTENNVVLKGEGTADLSKVNFKDYDSTKDVLIAPAQLDANYITNELDTNGFINFSDGTYGKDVVLSAGTFGAKSVKGGLYAAKYRQATVVGDNITGVDNEVMVVAGAASAASGDFSSVSTQIFAMTNNNEDISDSVIGSAKDDVFIAGKNDTVNGGKGNDKIYTDEKAVTVMLATGKETDNDVIYGWKANTGTIQLAEGKDFSNISVGYFDVDSDGAETNAFTFADGSSTNNFATFNVTDKGEEKLSKSVYVKVKDGDGVSKTALIFDGVAANDDITGLNADSISSTNLFVASGAGTNLLDFTGSGKGNIFLGHSEGKDAEFGDSAQYVNVYNVKSDTVGGAWLFGGGSKKVTLAAGGDDDSLWGAGSKNDTLVSNGTYRTSFGTTNGSGVDVLQNFKFGADAYGETTDTDVVYFVDGVDLSKAKVSDGKFIVGSSDTSALAFEISSASGKGTSDGALITYGLGLGGPKNVAKVDVTTTAGDTGTVTFEEDATLYIGRGEKTTLTFDSNNGNPVRFGFDSKYSGYKVGVLDGSEAVAGSLINGSTDRAQKVMASENGASSIAGGFGDGFKDANSDTLIGGGENDFGTTFFVGKDMGSDNIQNLSDGDTVVFLNTKVSDITNNINSDTYGKNVSVTFNTGNRITATSTNNIADIEGLTVKFDDGTFTYDGVSKSWVRANA